MNAAGKIEGDVRINGYPKEQASFARVAGYVEQFDTHTAAATVYEALLFSGTLRNGTEVDAKTTRNFVDQVCLYVVDNASLGQDALKMRNGQIDLCESKQTENSLVATGVSGTCSMN